MKIILDRKSIEKSFQLLLHNLKKDCVPLPAFGQGGDDEAGDAFGHPGLGFWFAPVADAQSLALVFGMESPGLAPEPVIEARFSLAGIDRRMSAFFVRFGKDVMVAMALGQEGQDPGLDHFLGHHGYDLARHAFAAPGDGTLEAVIIASVSSPSLAYNFFHFLSAANDCRKWAATGLLPGEGGGFLSGSRPSSRDRLREESGPGELRQLVEEGVREQLARRIESRNLRLKLGWTSSGDLALASPDNIVLAELLVGTSLDPDFLHAAVGRLILSRSALRAAKILVVPGILGPFLTQALFRHDIHVATYKLTRDMTVVMDTDAVFQAIQTV